MKRTFFFLSIFSVILAVNISIWYFSSNHLSSAEAMGESADVLPQGDVGISQIPAELFGCTLNSGWPSSANLKTDAPWSTLAFPILTTDSSYQPPAEQFLDVNGDGLADYMHRKHTINQTQYHVEDCVYINTGSGWDVAFRCQGSYDFSTPDNTRWYGDCADMSS
ncbi:hypothetical protein HZA38_04260 [Candidatus Peregrinibacteria bacterium]|nr:hypothetical protein [Candidatus Peregrinibacteria bacterium]